jgi:hypothetical protein
LFSLAWGGEPCRDEANVVAAIHVDDDDPSQDIESDRGESWLVRVRIIDRDRVRIAEYPFGVREANPVLPEIRPALAGSHAVVTYALCAYVVGPSRSERQAATSRATSAQMAARPVPGTATPPLTRASRGPASVVH